jgi:hypothetical protein
MQENSRIVKDKLNELTEARSEHGSRNDNTLMVTKNSKFATMKTLNSPKSNFLKIGRLRSDSCREIVITPKGG